MIYLDQTLDDFFKGRDAFKRLVQRRCAEEGFSFEKVKPFVTQKSYGVEIDPEGLITIHRPHNQEFWSPIRKLH